MHVACALRHARAGSALRRAPWQTVWLHGGARVALHNGQRLACARNYALDKRPWHAKQRRSRWRRCGRPLARTGPNMDGEWAEHARAMLRRCSVHAWPRPSESASAAPPPRPSFGTSTGQEWAERGPSQEAGKQPRGFVLRRTLLAPCPKRHNVSAQHRGGTEFCASRGEGANNTMAIRAHHRASADRAQTMSPPRDTQSHM